MKPRTWLICAAVLLLTVLPLWFAIDPAPQFAGADERALQAIGSLAPGYQPWFAPVFEPASGEIASLLFALQAALGAGVIGSWLGMSVARDLAARATPTRDNDAH